ncbi:MAG: NADH-quinone oxidoreductase subunit C [Longimicrobiales bacterium]
MAERFEDSLRHLATGPTDRDPQTAGGGERIGFDAHPAAAALRERFGEAVLRHELHAGDEHVVFIAPDRAGEILGWLRDTQEFDLLKDLTAVDFGGGRPLQVIYELWSIARRTQLRIKAELPLDRLEIDSVVPIWQTANWLEREAYDMFGIRFRGHPDLRRILMPEHYAEGFPLRKDFPLRGRFSRAEQTRLALSEDVADHYIPSELEFLTREGEQVEGAPPLVPGARRQAEPTGGATGERTDGATQPFPTPTSQVDDTEAGRRE